MKATLHWVSAAHAVDGRGAALRSAVLASPIPATGEGADSLDVLNPDSLEVLEACKLEPSLAAAPPGTRFQFERLGYFVVDPDSTPGRPVFNRTVTLKDTWAKIESKL